MNELVFELAIARFNTLARDNQAFYFRGARKGNEADDVIFETAFGEVTGFFRVEGGNLILRLGDRAVVDRAVITFPLSDFLGKLN